MLTPRLSSVEPRTVRTESASRTEPARSVASQAPGQRAAVRDGFDTRAARSNFVDRPTGRRPEASGFQPAHLTGAPVGFSPAMLMRPAAARAAPPAPAVETPREPKPTPSGVPVIAVFDGGVDFRHSDLDGAMWTNPGEVAGDGKDNDGNGIADDMHGFNVGFMSGDVMRGEGTDHGTHVAGIIAAEDNGQGNTGVAAGKAQVLSVGGIYDGADLLTNFERAVDYVVRLKTERGVNLRAVNASFGDAYPDKASQARWKAAVQKLADADILLVAATANGNGSNMNRVPDFPANLDLPNVLTVASMDRDNDKLARFSSHGDKVVELAAVGEDVLSTVPGGRWEEMSGTSMATPRVAGTAALMFAENPKLTAAQVRDLLVKTVEKDPDLRRKVSTGGKLDMAAAIAAARALAATAVAAR